MIKLIGINGKKGAGKDTSGAILSQLTKIPTYALANPLKTICTELFDFSEDHVYSYLKEEPQEFKLTDWKDKLILLSRDYFGEFVDNITNDTLINNFYRIVLLPNLFSENEYNQTALVKTSPRNILQLFGTNFARQIDNQIWIKLADKSYNKSGELIVTDIRFDNEAEWIKSRGGLVVSILRDKVENSGDHHISELGISNKLIDVKIDNNGCLDELKNSIELLIEYKISSPIINIHDLL